MRYTREQVREIVTKTTKSHVRYANIAFWRGWIAGMIVGVAAGWTAKLIVSSLPGG